MRHLNQTGLLPQENMDRWAIGIIGTGAIGSFVAMALTKMGFKNVVTWDDDKIEEHNIANQMFPVHAVGMKKSVATRQLIKDFSGEDAVCLSIRATGKKVVSGLRTTFPGKPCLYLLCVDSLDVRRELAEELAKDYGAVILDARMGAKTYRVLGFDTTNARQMADYFNSLVPDSEAVQERCGQKSIIYTVLGVAAETCSFIHKLVTPNDRGFYTMPEPVVFDYGTGMRLQKRERGVVEKLDEMPDTPEPAQAAVPADPTEGVVEVPF